MWRKILDQITIAKRGSTGNHCYFSVLDTSKSTQNHKCRIVFRFWGKFGYISRDKVAFIHHSSKIFVVLTLILYKVINDLLYEE